MDPKQRGRRESVCVCVWGGGSYSGLSSVVFVQDVERDLLGEAPQQARRVQVPLEAEQPVDPSFRGGAGRRGAASQPCCGGARRDMTSLTLRGLFRFI